MLFRRYFLLIGLSLLTLTTAHAQKGAPDVAGAEGRVEVSRQKVTELKAVADAARMTAESTKVQVKTQEHALKDLVKQLAKQEGELRVATAKQKAAEAQVKKDQVGVKEAKKREKEAAKGAKGVKK
ncbi:MAG: hypothetical protein H7330_09785 [Hymenobacteraceae bacterium]|nr:hypothetical protein [Hymenobacteraceae bacterium]